MSENNKSEQNRKVRVALDAMGGDRAPDEIVKGAVLAARNGDVEIVLTGPEDIMEAQLAKYNPARDLPVKYVPTDQIIAENEPPAQAVRRKSNSSLVVATKLVKEGKADAMLSAGNSGAIAISAIQHLGMIKGIERPAIGGTFGSFLPNVVLMDLGVNVDCKPYHLLAFAVAGSVFAKKSFHIANPTIGLLSTGREKGKGSEAVREAYLLLEKSHLNFIGNVEGNEILSGKANVVVCDGFTGNILLKFYESVGGYALEYAKRKLRRFPPLRALVSAAFNRLIPVSRMSQEGEKGGSGILWGINGITRIMHGNSRAENVVLAIASVKDAVKSDIVGCLKIELAKFTEAS
jgi:glycerol-3-phosphate acyltransferase PlsX